jgi:2-oxoglutarate dehydrogenase E2 component (dihydrolipoamide succinyltransferase)
MSGWQYAAKDTQGIQLFSGKNINSYRQTMIIEIKIPSPGESITEVAIGSWLVEDNSYVEKDQEIAEVETDKATLPLISPESGQLKIIVAAGEKTNAGDTACTVDTSVKPPASVKRQKKQLTEADDGVKTKVIVDKEAAIEAVSSGPDVKVTPLARRMMDQNNLNLDAIVTGIKRISSREVQQVLHHKNEIPVMDRHARLEERTPLSPLRRKLGKRLVAVKNETAMLTTFNEVDMSRLQDIRKKYQQTFQDKHGIKLGLVSFFAKACAEALLLFPRVNSMLDGDDLVTPNYVDIAIAVQTEKGLMVPVIRNAHAMSIARIEQEINILAQKARQSRLSIEEMTGGTFTITNGGVFGSMLSTPILNPPQSAILGMHNIVERPVVVSGQVVIRPVMYVALSYDHRLIDGRESVGFLVKVKEFIELPASMLFKGSDPERMLLEI